MPSLHYYISSSSSMRSTLLVLLILVVLANPPWPACSGDRLPVNMTLVRNAAAFGALCLDGSLPAYHLSRGFGAGAHNWMLQFEGGGWCNDLESCFERAHTRRGSTRYMNKLEDFNGILSNNASLNPDFYNWNRVKIRYCDGASFIGDSKFDNGTHVLYFKGHKIWEAVIIDLLPKGLARARKALLSGCSAGGLASFLHCEHFAKLLPNATAVKCLSDAGFFLDERDISLNYTQRYFYDRLIQLQGAIGNLNKNCTSYYSDPELCIFPQYLLKYIQTPLFILNTAYDVYQFHHILVPQSADPEGHWNRCKVNVTKCDESQLDILQGFREDMLAALQLFYKNSRRGGMFINSCFAHCQSESQDTWFAPDSPRINNKTIAEAVGDWFFGRNTSKKKIDGPYPCDKTCHNLIPASTSASVHDSLVNLGCTVSLHVLLWLFSPSG